MRPTLRTTLACQVYLTASCHPPSVLLELPTHWYQRSTFTTGNARRVVRPGALQAGVFLIIVRMTGCLCSHMLEAVETKRQFRLVISSIEPVPGVRNGLRRHLAARTRRRTSSAYLLSRPLRTGKPSAALLLAASCAQRLHSPYSSSPGSISRTWLTPPTAYAAMATGSLTAPA